LRKNFAAGLSKTGCFHYRFLALPDLFRIEGLMKLLRQRAAVWRIPVLQKGRLF